MKIILTGASGFLGQTIKATLSSSEIISVGRSSCTIFADLSVSCPLLPASDLVVHAAGKAHIVPKTEKEKREFYDVNVDGTKRLLEGLEQFPPRGFVFISSVAVYGILSGNQIKESDNLMAVDPYGDSKKIAEEIITKWCYDRNIRCTILRLPLVIGSGASGNLYAMIRGIQKGYYFNIGKGNARKSMVLDKDVAKILPDVADIGGVYNLTDGVHPSFSELSQLISSQLGKSRPFNMPLLAASLLAKAGDLIGRRAPLNSDKLKKITSDLTFDDSKARLAIGWNPTPVLQGFSLVKNKL